MSYQFPVLDLFSGIGGFSLGLERTGGFKTVAFCETEAFPRAVLEKHWPLVPKFGDIRELSAEDFRTYGIEPPKVICGGFPCQDISTAGAGRGLAGARSGLWFEYRRLIEELRPSWAIIENVSALRGRGLDAVLGSLSEIGYDAEWDCIPASAIGAPHQRDRIWIVAYPNPLRKLQPQRSQQIQRRRLSYSGSTMADADYEGLQGRQRAELPERAGERTVGSSGSLGDAARELSHRRGAEPEQAGRREPTDSGCSGESPISNTHGIGRNERVFPRSGEGNEERTRQAAPYNGWWLTEPDVGRVANGVPRRVDRLKGLGNAVVPQLPEMIGQAILEWELMC